MKQREYHIVLDYDDDRNLVFKPTKGWTLLDMIADAGHIARWSFTSRPTPQEEFIVVIYGAGPDFPQGENLEEINRRAVVHILTLAEHEDDLHIDNIS